MDGGRRVLVVDDEPDLCDLLRLYLAQHGIDVVAVGTASAALAEVRSTDVLLTDFVLPDGDGVTLVELARAAHPGLPAVLMSGLVVAERCTEAGIHLVPKPFGMRQMAAVLLALYVERPVPA